MIQWKFDVHTEPYHVTLTQNWIKNNIHIIIFNNHGNDTKIIQIGAEVPKIW